MSNLENFIQIIIENRYSFVNQISIDGIIFDNYLQPEPSSNAYFEYNVSITKPTILMVVFTIKPNRVFSFTQYLEGDTLENIAERINKWMKDKRSILEEFYFYKNK
ncbi:MAG: hypothetical protein HC932_02685 [Thermales bacterium]|nr:hypothetical protein [Thermales bacterium]